MVTRVENHSIIIEFSEQHPVSPIWEFGGFKVSFAQIQAQDEFRIHRGDYVKVIEGMLSDPLRLPMVGPFEKCSTVIQEDLIKAGKTSIVMIVSHREAPSQVNTPDQLQVRGPHSEELQWIQVQNLHWGGKFMGVEFFNLRGWDLRSSNKHLAYIQAWLAGSGVNCGNHNHSEMNDNTFREIHLCVRNGSGYGGMVWVKDREEYTLPLLPGEEHGPFWNWSDDMTKVVYPVHRWQAGISDSAAFDFWFAIEYPPPKAA
jgi:hypothetical protein